MDCYSISYLRQQSTDAHVAPLGLIVLIPSQLIFAITSLMMCANTNTKVLGLTHSVLEAKINSPRDEHISHYITMMAMKIAINGVKNSENELVAVSLIFGNIYHIVTFLLILLKLMGFAYQILVGTGSQKGRVPSFRKVWNRLCFVCY